MTTADFSRAAAHVLNAPYWTQEYPGKDVNECVRYHQARQREKEALTQVCSKIERAGGTFADMSPAAVALWKKAAQTLRSAGRK